MNLKEGEILVDAYGAEGYYKVSNYGRVFRVRFLPNCSFEIVNEVRSSPQQSGITVNMSVQGKLVATQLSSLVFDSFNRDFAGMRYKYVDGNRLNCNANNIVCRYPKMPRMGLYHYIESKLAVGIDPEVISENLGCSKERVMQIKRKLFPSKRLTYTASVKNLLKLGRSVGDIAEEVGCSKALVYAVKKVS